MTIARFADCPILLDFDGEQVEINHYSLDALSITCNTVDPALPVRWPIEDPFHLGWRQDAHPELAALHGQRLTAAELLEWNGADLARGTVAVSFVFTAHRLTIHNALDENGLAFGPPDHRYARTHLPAANSNEHDGMIVLDVVHNHIMFVEVLFYPPLRGQTRPANDGR